MPALTADHATVLRPHIVLVDGVAVHAALIEGLAAGGIAGQCGCLYGRGLSKGWPGGESDRNKRQARYGKQHQVCRIVFLHRIFLVRFWPPVRHRQRDWSRRFFIPGEG